VRREFHPKTQVPKGGTSATLRVVLICECDESSVVQLTEGAEQSFDYSLGRKKTRSFLLFLEHFLELRGKSVHAIHPQPESSRLTATG
jgi:hypothetical protein